MAGVRHMWGIWGIVDLRAIGGTAKPIRFSCLLSRMSVMSARSKLTEGTKSGV